MAFKVRTELNHSPQWYRASCSAEDGGSPAFRSMFKSDIRRLGADWDSNLSYQELIEIYESKWNEDETLARYAHEVTAVLNVKAPLHSV